MAVSLVCLGALAASFSTWLYFRARSPSAPSLRRFGVHLVWFEGAGDEDRAALDQFAACLIEGSNLHRFWDGRVTLTLRGSYALPPPATRLEWTDVADWLTPHVARGALPRSPADETPLYLVFGGGPQLWTGACGRNAAGVVAGREAALAIVRNQPLCWPAGGRLRTETQIATHELVETVDRALGFGACAGGGACRGSAICDDHCDTFVGLRCPGAPTDTWTGCEGGRVDGWVVQKFSRSGRDPARCGRCDECDFTPVACPEDDRACLPPRPPS